jgi:hypothetical protein
MNWGISSVLILVPAGRVIGKLLSSVVRDEEYELLCQAKP